MTCLFIHNLRFDIAIVSGFPPQSATRTKELQLGILDEAWPLYATTTIDLMNKITYLNYVLKSVGVREIGILRRVDEKLPRTAR